MEPSVQAYIDAIPDSRRALFDRVHQLILASCPSAVVSIRYQIPAYDHSGRRLYLGAWKHGVSLYGWQAGGDAAFLDRHPDLQTGKGTIRIPTNRATDVSDDELRQLIQATLLPPG